jgi:clan AA aspartic protease
MGRVYTRISLANPREPALVPIGVKALADTGALLLCVPRHVAVQLKLQELNQREVTVADGHRQLCPYVGPVHVTFGNRGCFVGALVLGDEVLLGAVPMEDMDLVVCPGNRSVVANPNSPNFPSAVVKMAR